ncbi:MAG: hypothetical protein JSR45_04570 [Proteobacteria bacterium]|nr:hypothetical protein [Pseudomonadota bacterium]
MKRLMSALAAAALFSASLGMTAYAAKDEKPAAPATYKDDQIKKGMAGAPAAAQALGLKCTIKNAALIGPGSIMVDNKKVAGTSYEVACGEGMGYVFLKYDKQDGGQTYSCVDMQAQYDAAIAAKKAAPPRCMLPENSNLNAQIQPVVTKSGAKCTVTNVSSLGHDPKNAVTNYEIACSEGVGYVTRAFDNGEATSTNCLEASATLHYECKLTDKTQRLAQITALSATYAKACQVSDGRFVGTTTDKHDLYEVACSGKPGFFLEVSTDGSARTIDCVSAQSIGGGCKMTDIGQAKQSAASGYTGTLQANGVSCTPTDFRVIGKEPRTKRDVVEFRCPEQPAGLLTLILTPGATGKFEKMDCFTAKERGLDCALTSKAELLARLKPILTAIDKVCTPTDYRMVSPDDGDGDIVEVKCSAGESGYILDLPGNRAKTIKTLSCAQAAKGNVDKCEIPGNA